MAGIENDPKRISSIINKIPNELLLAVVDKLSVVDAVSTGFLSRKWRDLWKYMSTVRFTREWVDATGKDITPSLNQFISLHKGEKIKEFYVDVLYEPAMSSSVDSWILFAMEKQVEELFLHLVPDNEDECYQLVPSVFNCKSVTSLRLAHCDVKLPVSVQLQSLQKVHFFQIELAENAIHTLTLGAPVLRYLFVMDCNRTRDLYIRVAPDRYLAELEIYDSFYLFNSRKRIVLNAPSVQTLTFCGYLSRSEYHIENITGCSSVKFQCDNMFYEYRKYGVNIQVTNRRILEWDSVLHQFLAASRKADSLLLCNWYIQLLSLRELRNSGGVTLYCTSLDIAISFNKWVLPGIIHMLKACPLLKKLVIRWDIEEDHMIKIPENFITQHDFQVKTYLENEMDSVTCKLKNLETIRFVITDGEYQTWEDRFFEMYHFFKGSKPAIELAALLTLTAKNLKSMIFESSKQCHTVKFSRKVEQHQAAR